MAFVRNAFALILNTIALILVVLLTSYRSSSGVPVVR